MRTLLFLTFFALLVPAAQANINQLGKGPKNFAIAPTKESAQAIADGKVSRGEVINMIASFDCASGSQAQIVLLPVEATIEYGNEKSKTSSKNSDDSTTTGELKIAVDLKGCVSDKRVEVEFNFKPSGSLGAAVNAQLIISGADASNGASSYLVSIDDTGKVKESDGEKIFADQILKSSGSALSLDQLLSKLNVIGPLSLEFFQKNASRFDISKFSAWDRIFVVGAMSFKDPTGCGSPVYAQSVNWGDCHKFKKQFKMNGDDRVELNGYDPEALRPLRAMLEVSYAKKDGDSFKVCEKRSVQTDKDGYFIVPFRGCNSPGSEIQITFKASLSYDMKDLTGVSGKVRAIWRKDQIEAFDKTTAEDTFKNSNGNLYSVASYNFTYKPETGEPVLGLIPVGNVVLLQNADTFSWHRQVLAAYSTVLSLHEKLAQELKAAKKSAYYKQMFISDAGDCKSCYTLGLDNTWAYGGLGFMSLYQPSKNAEQISFLLSDTTVLAHEFGHSVHSAFARGSLMSDYSFASSVVDSSGKETLTGHGWGQVQEMGTAFTEGLASTIGQYFLNGCEGFSPYRVAAGSPVGGPKFSSNMWNGDDSCDKGSDPMCAYHHFRWHMKKRNIAEGSPEWLKRLAMLKSIAVAGDLASVDKQILSAQEFRYAQFGCDLLDSNSDVNYVKTTGKTYLREFPRLVGWALDGKDVLTSISALKFDSDPQPETVHVGFIQLLEAMNAVCPSCSKLPPVGDPEYPKKRLAIQGEQAPQNLGKYLVKRKWASDEQMRNLLKANLMEVY